MIKNIIPPPPQPQEIKYDEADKLLCNYEPDIKNHDFIKEIENTINIKIDKVKPNGKCEINGKLYDCHNVLKLYCNIEESCKGFSVFFNDTDTGPIYIKILSKTVYLLIVIKVPFKKMQKLILKMKQLMLITLIIKQKLILCVIICKIAKSQIKILLNYYQIK